MNKPLALAWVACYYFSGVRVRLYISLLNALKSSKVQLAYVLVWRNDVTSATSATHYYAPFPGHSSMPDFLNFYNDPSTLFEKDLPNMYTFKKENTKTKK